MEKERWKSWRAGLRSVLSAALAMSVVMTGGLMAVRRLDTGETAPAFAESGNGARPMLVPMGQAIGIKLFSDGVLVVGLSPIETEQGALCPGRACGLKEGDVITGVNGRQVDTIEEVQRAVAADSGGELTIRAMRGKKSLQLTAAPVQNKEGEYQLGVWLRDSMAGIGTMTFYDPESGAFGALGHGVNDVDTSILMPMESGAIMAAEVSGVERGVSGTPGALQGDFDMSGDLGTLRANTPQGVFGTIGSKTFAQGREQLPAAKPSEVRTGEAFILSNIRGKQVERFSVEITKINPDSDGDRNLMLRVTDPRLLEATGGIVQGMSGSPILQNGKLIGAVTHVLINSPEKGYGIFIENMLEAAE